MKVTQEILPDSQVGLQIEVPAEVSKQTYEQVLRKLMNSANIPGFRRGKVPRQIFLQRMGAIHVRAAALEELIQTAVDQAIKQEEIAAIGNYQLTSGFDELVAQYQPGEPLTFSAAVDVPPRVTLKAYSGLTVQAEEIPYKSDRVDEVIQQYRLNLSTLVPVEDRPAQMGDVAVVDFEGKVQQPDLSFEPFEGGAAQDFQVEIKVGGFIEGFVEGMVGMTLDETREISVTFPEQYPQETLAGKPAIFTITLKELKEKELPELDDDFAQEVSEFETLAELQASLEERYRTEAQDKTVDNQRQAVLSALVEQLEAEIPETLVRREVNYLVSQMAVQLSRQGIDVNKLLTPEIVENMRDRSRPEALLRLKRTLALGEVAKAESISLEESVIEARVAEMLEEVNNPAEVDQERLREVINEELLQEKILDWLLENNTIELVPEGSLTPAEPAEAIEADEAPGVTIEAEASEVLEAEASEVLGAEAVEASGAHSETDAVERPAVVIETEVEGAEAAGDAPDAAAGDAPEPAGDAPEPEGDALDIKAGVAVEAPELEVPSEADAVAAMETAETETTTKKKKSKKSKE